MKSKNILVGFSIFLFFMWACTLISKSLYASKLPMVSVACPARKYIEHSILAEGIVEPGNRQPVTALSGLRVAKLAVREGDQVQEGDLLFTIDLEDLQKTIDVKQTDIDRLQKTIDTVLKNRELDAQRKALEEQRAREDYNALAVRQDILVERASEEVAKAENDIEDCGDPDNREMLESLKAAAYGEADAKWNREQTMKEAERKIEDLLSPEKADSSIDEYRLQITSIQSEISRYQDIIAAQGEIYSQQSGTVTNLFIDTGSRIPDTAVMLLSDDSVPCRLRITLTAEQKKYLRSSDNVTIKLEGKSRPIEAVVDYLTENENAPGTYTAFVELPEDTGRPGIAGTLSRSETGELYPCCIDTSVIHSTGTRDFIYVLREREGILGTEYYAEETNIKILDKNDSFAAIEGAINTETMIILSGTQEFHNGDTVRIY